MARILITGSAQGLGRGAATALIDDGHQVVVHARDPRREAALAELVRRGATVVVGDLASEQETRNVAAQINDLGRMDAIIHNAGVYGDSQPHPTPEGHPRTLAVNTLAPYLLTGLIQRPDRLIYLTSDMHRSGDDSLQDLDWSTRPWNGTQAYCDSKLFVTTLALAIARRWPGMISNAVDPGWVPTRMGGSGAPDNLEQGHMTQVWLAVTDASEADLNGKVWHHHQPVPAASAAHNPDFQNRLINRLAELTGLQFSDAPTKTF
ncbi:SDR family NAD(P)-dependent oxidoreductase [Angustibacter sp. McL0619]|uniref:SDR family NAD(P)-dependent oxidoreductase n=1 Tax=Angustibacter sp. McL0619 TaxID=3415676 RepID=UPI003CF778FC